MLSCHWLERLVLSSAVTGRASLTKLVKGKVTCTETWEVWSTAGVTSKAAAVGPPVAVRWTGWHLLFARQSLGVKSVPGECMTPVKKSCTPFPWQCKRLRSSWVWKCHSQPPIRMAWRRPLCSFLLTCCSHSFGLCFNKEFSITTRELLHFNKLFLKANAFHLGEAQFYWATTTTLISVFPVLCFEDIFIKFNFNFVLTEV